MKKILALLLLALFTFGLTACNDDGEVPEDIIDCLTNPELPECDTDDPDDPIDERTAEEILADTIIDNWTGDLEFLTTFMDNMDFSEGMEQVTHFNLELVDEEDVTHVVDAVITDRMVDDGMYVTLNRLMEINFDGELMEFEFIFEEVETGVVVYINIAYLRESLPQDALDIFATLGVDQDWVAFHFDDTLENMIQIEVVKQMLMDILFDNVGETFFTDVQAQILAEFGIDLSLYGIDLGMFVQYIYDGDYDLAENMLNNADFEGLVLELDLTFLVPEVVLVLQDFQVPLEAEGFDVVGTIADLEANGVIATLETLTDEEISTLLEVLIDQNSDPDAPDFSEIYDQFVAGTLDHYLIMMFLTDPGVAEGLGQIPGFDYATFVSNMDTLDYDALYLETIDVDALANAIYGGQVAFEAYVAGLATTAPETAKVLGPWAGFVGEINMYMVYVDEVNYALDAVGEFEKYFTMDYYLDHNMMDIELEKTEDFEILTTMTLSQTAYAGLFIDLLGDVYGFLDGFETFEMPYVQHINCPIGETCEPFPEYLEVLNVLTQMGEMNMTMLMDPSDPHHMTMEMDFTSFINALMLINAGFTEGPITNLSMDMTMRDSTAITLPESSVNLNVVAEEFAHFAIFLETHDYVRELMWYYENYPDQLAANFGLQISFREMQDNFWWWFRFSEVFDPEMSYMMITGSILNPDVEIQLYWRDGTTVFDEPLLLSELALILDNEGAPTRADYLAMIELIDEENFHVTKMFLMFMLK